MGWGGPACLLHHVPPDSQRPESGFGETAGIGGVKAGREAWAAPWAALARALVLPILQTHTHPPVRCGVELGPIDRAGC